MTVPLLKDADGNEVLAIAGENLPVRPVPAPPSAGGDRPGRPVRLLHHGPPLSFVVETEADRLRAGARPPPAASGPVTVTSPLPGVVRKVLVAPGDRVERDAPLVTLEAMKMENEVRAERAGVVGAVLVEPGRQVDAGAPLVRIDPDPAGNRP